MTAGVTSGHLWVERKSHILNKEGYKSSSIKTSLPWGGRTSIQSTKISYTSTIHIIFVALSDSLWKGYPNVFYKNSKEGGEQRKSLENMFVCVRFCVWLCVCVCVYACVYSCVCVCLHVCLRVHVSLRVCERVHAQTLANMKKRKTR